jgi:Transglutaminase-like superfamily
MLKKITLFYHIPFRRKFLLLLTVVLSLYTWLLMHFFKKKTAFGQINSQINIKNVDKALISDIRFALRVVNKYVPYESVCRHQAYQALLLCTYFDIPYQIYVGFKKSDTGKIEGHAWTMVQGEMITGFCNPEDYTVQAIYS